MAELREGVQADVPTSGCLRAGPSSLSSCLWVESSFGPVPVMVSGAARWWWRASSLGPTGVLPAGVVGAAMCWQGPGCICSQLLSSALGGVSGMVPPELCRVELGGGLVCSGSEAPLLSLFHTCQNRRACGIPKGRVHSWDPQQGSRWPFGCQPGPRGQ